jgi:glycosyltransferase involved in cell wall biosynthesis
MKIIHVSTATSWRGGEQQIAYLLSGMREAGVQQLVICPYNSPLQLYCQAQEFPFISYIKKNSLGLFTAQKLAQLCRKDKNIIVHAHDSHAHTMVWLSGLLFSNKAPLIVHRRVDFPVKDSWFSLKKYNFRQITRFICVSNAIREVLIKALKKPEKAVVIRSCTDLQRFENIENNHLLREEFNLNKNHILVGNVAALADHKDYPTFLQTAELVCKEDERFRFIIIGEGFLRSEIEQFISDHHLGNRVFMTGFRSNIPQLLKDLDIFFMPSKLEGLGTSVLDAFASGIPVVSTFAGGIPELVTHQESGLLSKPGDCQQMADHIRRLADNEPLRAKLLQNASVRVKEMDYHGMTNKTLSIYKEILSHR